jgi:hypothetical protein
MNTNYNLLPNNIVKKDNPLYDQISSFFFYTRFAVVIPHNDEMKTHFWLRSLDSIEYSLC